MSNKIHKNDDMEISSDDEEPPTEEEIKAAATKLSKRLDMSTTTFKKFNRLLCDDLDMEDLTPAKGIVKKVYHDATAEHAGDKANDLPTDSEIVKAATKLAASSRVDLDEITNAKFLRMLSKRMAVDLTMKKKLVHSTLKQCRVEYYRGGSPPTSAPSPIVETSPRLQAEEDLSVTEKSTTEKSITECYSVPGSMPDADAVMVDHCGLEAPKSVVEKPRKSADLEVGFKVPEASELSWTDDFFDADTDGLVAVFDYVSSIAQRVLRIFFSENNSSCAPSGFTLPLPGLQDVDAIQDENLHFNLALTYDCRVAAHNDFYHCIRGKRRHVGD